MKINLKDRVANLYHKQQGIPRAGHVMSQPVSIAETMQDCVHSGWLLKVGFSVRTWKRRYFVLTNHALFYYKTDKSPRQQGEILLSHVTEVAEVKDPHHKPNSMSITTFHRIFYLVGADEEDTLKWIKSLTSKMATKVGQSRIGMEVVIDPESFPPMCQEAQVIATELTQMKTVLLESFGEGSNIIQKQMIALQEKFESFEREYGYIEQAQQLGKEIRECLETCGDKLVGLQAEEEAQFQASKIRSKANWLKDAIDVGDPEQLARHIYEMRLAFIPFKEKYGKVTPVRSVVPMIREFDTLLSKADSALSLIDENLDKLDGIDIIVGKITWLSDAIERGTMQDLEKHIQEMKEILSAFVEKHGQDQNALPITNQGQELLEKAKRRLAKLQQLRPESPASPNVRPSSSFSSLSSSSSSFIIVDAAEAQAHAQAQILAQIPAQGGVAQPPLPIIDPHSELRDSDGVGRGGSGSGLLGSGVYCSMKHTGKAGKLQKYVVCLTCENYEATICLNCRDVCHAGHDVTYEREAECACYCGMGAFSSPCACFVSQVTRKTPAEIEEMHNHVVESRKSKTFVNMVNEISLVPNPNPPAGWSDTARDPCGLIFANSSKKDQGFTSELHKKFNMTVVFGKQAILKGMGEEALVDSFTDDDPIYGRVFLPAAPARIPVSAYPGEEVGYSKVSCFTGIVLYVDGRLWLPPNSNPTPIASSSSFSGTSSPFGHLSPSLPSSPRRKYTTAVAATSIAQSASYSFSGIGSPTLTSHPHSAGPSRRAHHMGHVRSQSTAGVPGAPSPANSTLPPLGSSYHTNTEVAALASVSAVAAAAISPAVATAVARKSISRRDSINRIRRYSYNASLSNNNNNNATSPPATSPATSPPNATAPTTSPPKTCTCKNTNSCASCLSPATSPIMNSTTNNNNNNNNTKAATTTTFVPPIPLLLPTLIYSNSPGPTRPHRTHARTNSNVTPSGPIVGGGNVLSPDLTSLTIDKLERVGGGLVTSLSASHVGLTLYDSVDRANLASLSLEPLAPITPPNHFFELSMVSGEPQWEWTTYRLMFHNAPNDPDVKIYQTQIANWQKVVMDLTPGTHKIRVEIALGPNPPIRYCAAYGEFDYTVTEAHTTKVKKAEQDALHAMNVKEWKDKYTYGTVESEIAGKWVYQMDGSLKCRDGPYTGAEYYWTGEKLEKKSGGLDCVYECYWRPNKHPPELDVHFLPELATCGFTISHPFVSLILTNSGVTVSGSVPPPLVTLMAELRFIDREYRQSRAEWEYKSAQKKKYEEIKSHLIGRVCPSCSTGQNWLICTKCFVDFCGCYTSIDPHCPVCNCIDNLTSFSENFPP